MCLRNMLGYLALGMGACVILITLLPSTWVVVILAILLLLCGLFSLKC